VTTAQLEEFATLMRRLFHGDTILGYDGVLGAYPALRLDPDFDEDVKLGLVAFGPNSLALGGRAFDKVILHTFFTDETLQRCVRTVKGSAEQAGRNPDDVEVWSCLATVGDHLPAEARLRKTVGRLATYLQGYGDLMVRTNQWDPAALQRFREDEVVKGSNRPVQHHASSTVPRRRSTISNTSRNFYPTSGWHLLRPAARTSARRRWQHNST
jgi:alkanesulfonate monooxygenase SsuD/methylene tetrahydromethanopterin reductase-like flavin-dependent oxidoreductase (luciferase family)